MWSSGRRSLRFCLLAPVFVCLVRCIYAGDLISVRPPALSTGVKQILVIRVDFADLPDSGHLASSLQSVMDTQVRPKFQQSSYGLADIVTTVTATRYRMPRTASYYATTPDRQGLMEDAVNAASVDYPVSNYDRHVVVFPSFSKIVNSKIKWAGKSDIPGGVIQSNGGETTRPYEGPPRSWINGAFQFRVVSHELGHTFGVEHSGLWHVTDGNPVSPAGSLNALGDTYDIMGTNSGQDTRIDFNPWFKYEMQWLHDEQVQTITESGVYRVYRYDDPAATGILALKVNKNTATDYWISLRRSFTDNASMQNGAYIIWGHNTNVHSALLDCTTPGTSIADAALQVSHTLTDGGIAITPLANGGTPPHEYMDIQVVLPTPGPTPNPKPDLLPILPTSSGPNHVAPIYVDAYRKPGRLLYRFDAVIYNRGGTFDLIQYGANATTQQIIWSGGSPTTQPDPNFFASDPHALAEDTGVSMVYDSEPGHHHFHFPNAYTYDLAGRPLEKVGFAMFDSYDPGGGFHQSWFKSGYIGVGPNTWAAPRDPSASFIRMGISPGKGDIYNSQTAEQWIDVTGLAPASYTLTGTVNPDGYIDESDTTNNSISQSRVIPGATAQSFSATALSGVGADVNLVGGVVGPDIPARLSGTCSPTATSTACYIMQASTTDLTFAIASQPANGIVVIKFQNGLQATATYTSTPGFIGTDRFTYTTKDTRNLTSLPATVSITVR
jgi:M6 family metalloprotease-like protein